MALRAKKPVVKQPRLKTLIYADKGVGKTHFCCTFPDTYYIDTEGLEDYPDLTDMLLKSGGDFIYLTEMTEIIKEVKELLSTKHNYKTLIIDSISFPYAWLSQLEVERLVIKSPHTEGTEFGANLAKAKRLTFHLGILLSRLDMNVIVTAHEKSKFVDSKEVGKTYDINEKMAYSLGSVWQLMQQGNSRKLFIEKSRYSRMKKGDHIDITDGYPILEKIFGEEIFKRESENIIFSTKDQLNELNILMSAAKITDEVKQKWLMAAKSQTFDEMPQDKVIKCIEKLKQQLQGEAA